jgi:hypothetical protein
MPCDPFAGEMVSIGGRTAFAALPPVPAAQLTAASAATDSSNANVTGRRRP